MQMGVVGSVKQGERLKTSCGQVENDNLTVRLALATFKIAYFFFLLVVRTAATLTKVCVVAYAYIWDKLQMMSLISTPVVPPTYLLLQSILGQKSPKHAGLHPAKCDQM